MTDTGSGAAVAVGSGCASDGSGGALCPSAGLTAITVSDPSGANTVTVAGTIVLAATLTGGSGADTLTGGSGADTIDGNGGDDILNGLDGSDTIHGGQGNDKVDAGFNFASGDHLFGDEGGDELLGWAGADDLHGGDGNDLLMGHGGNDSLFGDEGDDDLRGQDDNDVLLSGGGGDDYIRTDQCAFAMHGDGKGWIDTVNGVLFAEGYGEVKVLGWRGAQGNFLFNSSTPIAIACLRSPGGVEAGVSFRFKLALKAFQVGGCELGPYRATAPAGASSAGAFKAKGKSRSFRVPRGLPLLAIEIPGKGPSGAPVLKIRGPSGSFTTGALKPSEGRFVRALPNGPAKTTYLLLSRPMAGRWTVTAQKGSSIGALRLARPAPEPQVSATTSGSVCGPRLRWSLKRQPAQSVMLVDEGEEGDTRVLVEKAKAKGSLSLAPPAPGVRRVRAVVFQGGGLRETIPLATYGGPGAPSGLRVKRAKAGLTVSWQAACGVSSYRVVAGMGRPKVVSGTSATIAKPAKRGTITVTSLVDGAPVGSATRPLAPGTS